MTFVEPLDKENTLLNLEVKELIDDPQSTFRTPVRLSEIEKARS